MINLSNIFQNIEFIFEYLKYFLLMLKFALCPDIKIVPHTHRPPSYNLPSLLNITALQSYTVHTVHTVHTVIRESCQNYNKLYREFYLSNLRQNA